MRFMNTEGVIRLGFAIRPVLLCVCGGGLIAGCGNPDADAARSRPLAPVVRIDRSRNGSAAANSELAEDAERRIPRRLSFVISGDAPHDRSSSDVDGRAAATQAAVIDAFYKAAAEARRARGRSVTDFTAHMGPRLTLTHRSLDDGYEVRVQLISRGAETTFHVRNGQLMHPPQDLRLIEELFTATNGEFALLETRQDPLRNAIAARIGCYVPAAMDTAVAGEAANESGSSP